MKFTEAQLQSVFATQLKQESYKHQLGGTILPKEDEMLIESLKLSGGLKADSSNSPLQKKSFTKQEVS